MKKFLENAGIVLSIVIVLTLIFSASYVFAKDEPSVEKKSYYVDSSANDGYTERELGLSTKLTKKYENIKNSYEYELSVVDGNVISTSVATGNKESIYSKGDAKYIGEVNYYYYDSKYIIIVTENGEVYANIYKSNQSKMKFRKIATKNKVKDLKVTEKKQRFYEYPSVQLIGIDEEGNEELIKL